MIKFTWRIALVAGLLAAAQSAFAADTTVWTVDPAKSKLGFSGSQTGQPFSGSFARYTAVIAFNPTHLDTSRIRVTVELASAATGDPQRDDALPGGDWFDISQFPQATFVSNKILKKPDGTYEADGNLTLRGATHPLTLPFKLDIDGTHAHAKGHANLVRTSFRIGQGQWTTGDYVGLDVGIDVDIVANRTK